MIRPALLLAVVALALTACAGSSGNPAPTPSGSSPSGSAVSALCSKAHRIGSEVAAAIAAQGHPRLHRYAPELQPMTIPRVARKSVPIANAASDLLLDGALMPPRFIDWARVTAEAVRLEHVPCS